MKVAKPFPCGCGIEHRLVAAERGEVPDSPSPVDSFTVEIQGRQAPVLEQYEALARALDHNQDGQVTDEEILPPGADLAPIQIDQEDFTLGLRHHLAGFASPHADHYPSAAQVSSKLDELAEEYPALAQKIQIGTSEEGRPIEALRIGTGASGSKPGVLVVGGQHAREWAPNQAVTQAAERLLAGYGNDAEMTQRVNEMEIWMVPMANPDGYEFARNADPDWRKNRSTHHPDAVGVDLNRNYRGLYRIPGDAPDKIADDVGASDDPNHLTYRGPHAVSEKESQALTDFMDTHPSLDAVLDVHAFGRLILFPGTQDESREARYREVAGKIQEKLDVPYTPLSIPELYPTTGDINAYGEKLGLLSMGLEIGTSFQPSPDKAPAIRERGANAILAFLDEVVPDPPPEPEPPEESEPPQG